ncbi:hypothetical protein HY933_01460 [Candidatus Falkowbacteria bacterium]|nr:hypothetical protein [Candidatus Falkowbacteria bacterium]
MNKNANGRRRGEHVRTVVVVTTSGSVWRVGRTHRKVIDMTLAAVALVQCDDAGKPMGQPTVDDSAFFGRTAVVLHTIPGDREFYPETVPDGTRIDPIAGLFRLVDTVAIRICVNARRKRVWDRRWRRETLDVLRVIGPQHNDFRLGEGREDIAAAYQPAVATQRR